MEIEYHSLIKVQVLKKYLEPCNWVFRKKDGSKGLYGDFVYFETHAGDGEYMIKNTSRRFEGSAVEVSRLQPHFPCILMEKDQNNINKLKKLLESVENVEIMKGDCNTDIGKLLSKTEEFNCKLAFGFLDPYGHTDLKWETVEKIMSHDKTELLIHFPASGIIRNFPNKGSWQGVTEYFGTEEWIEIAEDRLKDKINPLQAYEQLVKLYIWKLHEGYKFIHRYRVHLAGSDIRLYELIFATDHPLGDKIGSHVVDKTVPSWVKADFQRIRFQTRSLSEFIKS